MRTRYREENLTVGKSETEKVCFYFSIDGNLAFLTAGEVCVM